MTHVPGKSAFASPAAAALAYARAGLAVVAAGGGNGKGAVVPWAEFQNRIPGAGEIAGMFSHPRAERVAIICGAVSGNLECLDFDDAGSAFDAWAELVEAEAPGLPARLPMERSPSGGRHVLYRVPDMTIPGGRRLAERPDAGGGTAVLIETRAEKQYFCACPSPGYAMLQGELTAIPAVSPDERGLMIRAAEALDERPAAADRGLHPPPPADPFPGRPGDDFNRRGDVRGVLARRGWTRVGARGPNEWWRRPGKRAGISATLRNCDGVEVFFPFTTSTAFTAGRGYSPYQVYAVLDHGGDFSAAARELGRSGYGGAAAGGAPAPAAAAAAERPAAAAGPGAPAAERRAGRAIADPGPFPDRLLRVPGFIGDFAGYINRRAVKPQPVLSLGAAIVALGTLAGRKVEGVTGLRTNFYILGVAESGTGKDMPRELARQLLYDPANAACYAVDRLKSDSGIRSALAVNPCVVFLLDEIGEFLDTIKNARRSPWLKNIIPELMMLYSLAQSPNVRLGGYADIGKTIETSYPHVSLFGTSVPASVFRSMTMDSVGGGFLGRLLIFESATGNPPKQRPSREALPAGVAEAVEWWREFKPGGNPAGGHCGSASAPLTVGESGEATGIFDALEAVCRRRMDACGAEWSGPYNRTEENARKLALIHACSERRENPRIGAEAARWGSALAFHLTERLVHTASLNVADNETHDRHNRVLRAILEARDGVSRSELLRKCRFIRARELTEIVEALEEAGDIVSEDDGGKTRAARIFRAGW
jgi:hypothetical protein